eukprot:TRINITY_DN168_c0_g1_i1.p1 TRINITY_DN168_c0_g1~~TRINITY_DN168_c0_g1_i1.p1  ORF type:complete len:235 (+),score=29.47 TRINITY_DN168_c0_g1_i1:58-762(+)
MVVSYGVGPVAISYAVHVLGLAAIVLVLVWSIHFRGGLAWSSSDKNLIFNLHPPLMIGGFLFVSSEAILIYKTLGGSKQYRKAWHLGLQLAAAVLGFIGIWAAFKYHNESSIDNLYSLHSWLGLTTAILFGLQWLSGFVTFWYPGLSPQTRKQTLPWHVFSGLLIYGLALATVETGILEKLTFLQNNKVFGHYDFEPLLINGLGILVALFGGLVVLAAVIPKPSAENEGYAPIE